MDTLAVGGLYDINRGTSIQLNAPSIENFGQLDLGDNTAEKTPNKQQNNSSVRSSNQKITLDANLATRSLNKQGRSILKSKRHSFKSKRSLKNSVVISRLKRNRIFEAILMIKIIPIFSILFQAFGDYQKYVDIPLHIFNGFLSLMAVIHLVTLIDRESQTIFNKIGKSVFLILDIFLNAFLIYYAYTYYTEHDLDSQFNRLNGALVAPMFIFQNVTNFKIEKKSYFSGFAQLPLYLFRWIFSIKVLLQLVLLVFGYRWLFGSYIFRIFPKQNFSFEIFENFSFEKITESDYFYNSLTIQAAILCIFFLNIKCKQLQLMQYSSKSDMSHLLKFGQARQENC